MSYYNQLKDVLDDIFELNKADLDFGIYRIMNQKRKQVNEFIEKRWLQLAKFDFQNNWICKIP